MYLTMRCEVWRIASAPGVELPEPDPHMLELAGIRWNCVILRKLCVFLHFGAGVCQIWSLKR